MSRDGDDAVVTIELAGSFRRAFTLPAHVTPEAVSATYEAGVLHVRLAGAYAANAGATRIEVTSDGDTKE